MSPYGAEACFVETIWCTSTYCSVMSLHNVPLHWPLQERSSQYCPVCHQWTTLRCKHSGQFWKHSSALGLEVSCKQLNFSVKCTSVTPPLRRWGYSRAVVINWVSASPLSVGVFDNWQAWIFGCIHALWCNESTWVRSRQGLSWRVMKVVALPIKHTVYQVKTMWVNYCGANSCVLFECWAHYGYIVSCAILAKIYIGND